jgi:threonine 3-dehydrogenase
VKALRKLYSKPGIWLDEVEKPTIKPDEVLIKIHKTAICGTDIHIYQWDEWAQGAVPVPMTIGHEYAGTIVEVGAHVHGYQIGDRVSGEGHITCGLCRNCKSGRAHLCEKTVGIGIQRPGCFAEYLALPASNAVHLPEAISDTFGAILDPLGNAVHTTLSYDLVGENVLITGAGPIGIMAASVARFVGAAQVVITDVNEYRLNLVREMNAAIPVNLKTESLEAVMARLQLTEGFDVGLEMSGNPNALIQMIANMRPGGKIALLGILPSGAGIDWQQVIFKGLQLKGIYGREMYETWHKMLNLLKTGLPIVPIVTHQFPMSEFALGFELMSSGQTGKVVLEWT